MMYGKGYVSPYSKGGWGKGDGWGEGFGAAGFGKGGDGWGEGYGKAGFGKAMFGKGKGGWGSESETGGLASADVVEEGGGGGGSKKKRSGGGGGWSQPTGPGPNSWGGDIEGFKEALSEAFEAAEVQGEDFEEIFNQMKKVTDKLPKKWYNDERAKAGKMTRLQASSFLCEYVEAFMGSLSAMFEGKDWFDKISWNGALLMLVIYTFDKTTIFNRVVKTEIIQLIDEALLQWSEEERITKAMWTAIETAGMADNKQKKKCNQHLLKAYDDAHFMAPFWSADNESLGEAAAVHDFVKGWIDIFVGKAHGVLENGCPDNSPTGMAHFVTALFTALMDQNNPCLPISLQPNLPAAPWGYIEQCVNAAFQGPDAAAAEASALGS